jgi:hypothetical protein
VPVGGLLLFVNHLNSLPIPAEPEIKVEVRFTLVVGGLQSVKEAVLELGAVGAALYVTVTVPVLLHPLASVPEIV